MKQGHIGLDSVFDLWLLGHFKLRIFRLVWGIPNWTVKPRPFSYSGKSGLKEIT